MEGLGSYLATIVASLIVGYVLHWIEPRSKIRCWSPHSFHFELPGGVLQTNSVAIYNAGRRPAKNIEIIHSSKPTFFQLWPALPYTEETTPRGEHIIRLSSLGPRESVFLQILGSPTLPEFRNLRWEGGQGHWIPVQLQRVWPRWASLSALAVFLVGIGFLVYWVAQLVLWVLLAFQ